jgi:hypothetical protein
MRETFTILLHEPRCSFLQLKPPRLGPHPHTQEQVEIYELIDVECEITFPATDKLMRIQKWNHMEAYSPEERFRVLYTETTTTVDVTALDAESVQVQENGYAFGSVHFLTITVGCAKALECVEESVEKDYLFDIRTGTQNREDQPVRRRTEFHVLMSDQESAERLAASLRTMINMFKEEGKYSPEWAEGHLAPHNTEGHGTGALMEDPPMDLAK